MKGIGAYIPCSFVDYPGHIASVIFLNGCNMTCPYCHNRELARDLSSRDGIELWTILTHLKKRQSTLSGVVISGGEPTCHPDLVMLLRKIKEFKYKIKLDTNGSNPKLLKMLIDQNLVDFIAMDIKSAPSKYFEICSQPFESIVQSIHYIKTLPHYEFRTTVYPTITEADIRSIYELTDGTNYILQKYRPNCNSDLPAYPDSFIEKISESLHIGYR